MPGRPARPDHHDSDTRRHRRLAPAAAQSGAPRPSSPSGPLLARMDHVTVHSACALGLGHYSKSEPPRVRALVATAGSNGVHWLGLGHYSKSVSVLSATGSTVTDARRGRPRSSLSAHAALSGPKHASVPVDPALSGPTPGYSSGPQLRSRFSLSAHPPPWLCAAPASGECRSLPAYRGADSESAVTVGPTPGRGRIDPRDGRERIEPRCSLRRGGGSPVAAR